MIRVKLIVILFLLVLSITSNAQDSTKIAIPISVGYWGHYISNPGYKIGTQFNLAKWDKVKERKKKTIIKHKSFFIKPEFGLYNKPLHHTGLLLNTDFGIEKSKNDRKWYSAKSIGIGYFRQINAGTTYELEGDDIIEKRFGSRGYFLPSLSYEFGQHFKSISWYNKLSLASKIKYNTGLSAEGFYEIGIKFNLNLKKKTNEKL